MTYMRFVPMGPNSWTVLRDEKQVAEVALEKGIAAVSYASATPEERAAVEAFIQENGCSIMGKHAPGV